MNPHTCAVAKSHILPLKEGPEAQNLPLKEGSLTCDQAGYRAYEEGLEKGKQRCYKAQKQVSELGESARVGGKAGKLP